jgi:hypothetical protein
MNGRASKTRARSPSRRTTGSATALSPCHATCSARAARGQTPSRQPNVSLEVTEASAPPQRGRTAWHPRKRPTRTPTVRHRNRHVHAPRQEIRIRPDLRRQHQLPTITPPIREARQHQRRLWLDQRLTRHPRRRQDRPPAIWHPPRCVHRRIGRPETRPRTQKRRELVRTRTAAPDEHRPRREQDAAPQPDAPDHRHARRVHPIRTPARGDRSEPAHARCSQSSAHTRSIEGE